MQNVEEKRARHLISGKRSSEKMSPGVQLQMLSKRRKKMLLSSPIPKTLHSLSPQTFERKPLPLVLPDMKQSLIVVPVTTFLLNKRSLQTIKNSVLFLLELLMAALFMPLEKET